MELGMIGTGKMGAFMARRLAVHHHRIVAYDCNISAVQALHEYGVACAETLEVLVGSLALPRTVWVMVPAGEATGETIRQLTGMLSPGDTVIDGGNSNYKDSIRNAEALARAQINFLDVGTSGGIWGLTEGYSLMIGGPEEVVERHRPLFEALAPAPDRGWGRVGPNGAGHFAKMVHNGIEYGLMQAYAEGLEILHSKDELISDMAKVTAIWQHGSVVRSWLLDLIAPALCEDADLDTIRGYVPDSGEGRWTVAEAIDLDVPAPVITLSLLMRLASRQDTSYSAKILALMRNRFGGHAVKENCGHLEG